MRDYTVNGVLITSYKQWAVNLVIREASGEQLPIVSAEAWRNVLAYPADMLASKVVGDIERARAQVKN